MSTELDRRYTHSVRPLHLETEDSYTQRLLAANFENETHKRYLSNVAKSATGCSSDEAWPIVLKAKTGRRFHFGATTPAPLGATEQHECALCPAAPTTRFMCQLCSHSVVAKQATSFTSPICVRHRRWVGPTDEIRVTPQQPLVTEDAVKAARRFTRLQRQGRMTPTLFTVLRHALRPQTFGIPKEEKDAATFSVLVTIAGAVTTKTFMKALFDPRHSYAEAHSYLAETVATAGGGQRPEVDRALWEFLKPTFWALRHAVRTSSGYVPAWAHDYAVPEDIADTYVRGYVEAPFTDFGAAAASASAKPSAFILDRGGMTVCDNGHHVKAAKKCPVCTNSQVAPGYNDLATVNPTIAKQLDPILNGTVTAHSIAAATHKDLAWRCPRAGHVYWATGSNRTQAGSNCGICSSRTIVPGVNDITTTHPSIAAEIHPDYAKGHPPAKISGGSEVRPEWLCPTCGDTYKMTAYDRTHGGGCDPCRRARLRASRDNLTVTHPNVVALWHPDRNNKKRPDEYTYSSKEVVWWLCTASALHYYDQRIDRKVAGYGCTLCSNRKLVPRVNDLATTDPLLTMEFHADLNGPKSPDLIFAGTDPYYWKCLAAGHVKRQSVPNRRKSKGCTGCEPEDRILAGFN